MRKRSQEVHLGMPDSHPGDDRSRNTNLSSPNATFSEPALGELGDENGRSQSFFDRILSPLIAGTRPWASHALVAPAGIWLLLCVGVPILLIFALSFTQRGPYGAIAWHFTTANYFKVLNPSYLPILLRSLIYAGSATLLCLTLGYPVAYALSFYAKGWRDTLMILIMLPFWTSCLVAIYSWIIILGREGLVNGLLLKTGIIHSPVQFLNRPFAVILGLVYFYLPFMVLPLYGCLEKIPRALIEASKDLGAGVWTTFARVTLPLSLPGIAAGCILTFIPCVGDFLTVEFLGGPRTYLIGNLIENQYMMSQDWPLGSAAAMVLILLLISGLYLYLRVEGTGVETGRGRI